MRVIQYSRRTRHQNGASFQTDGVAGCRQILHVLFVRDSSRFPATQVGNLRIPCDPGGESPGGESPGISKADLGLEGLTPFEISVDRIFADDGRVRDEIRYTTFDGEDAYAVILRPTSDACQLRPGLLLMHPHDASSDDMTEPRENNTGALSLELAKDGFVTLTPDIRSFGRFRPGGMRHWGSGGYVEAVESRGETFIRLAINDARVALALLRNTPGVDPERIGMAGLSVGSFITLVTSVVETDVRATVLSNLFLPFEILFTEKHHSCQHLHGLEELGAIHELAATILPRPLQVHWGEDDVFYAPHHGDEATADLEGLASELGYAEQLDVHVSPGLEHAFDPPAHAAFFHLTLGRVPTHAVPAVAEPTSYSEPIGDPPVPLVPDPVHPAGSTVRGPVSALSRQRARRASSRGGPAGKGRPEGGLLSGGQGLLQLEGRKRGLHRGPAGDGLRLPFRRERQGQRDVQHQQALLRWPHG